MLTKKAILEAQDIIIETVSVPEWGGNVKVRGLNGMQRDQFEQMLIDQKKAGGKFYGIRALLCALSIIDDDGNLIFSEEDIEALGKKSAAALDRVADVVRRLSGLSPEDIEAAEKNL